MSSLVEIKDNQAERLQKISAETGVRLDALVEEALELLFLKADRDKVEQEERDYLRQLEAEDDGSLQVKTRSPFRKTEIKVTHVIPVEASTPGRL